MIKKELVGLDRQTHRHTDTQTLRHTDTQTDTHTHRQTVSERASERGRYRNRTSKRQRRTD